jgi:hypothetical protein
MQIAFIDHAYSSAIEEMGKKRKEIGYITIASFLNYMLEIFKAIAFLQKS